MSKPKKAKTSPIKKPKLFEEHSEKFENIFLTKGWRMVEVKRKFVDEEYLPWVVQNVVGRFAFHPEFDRGYFDPKARFFYFERAIDANKFTGQFNGEIFR
jgi:hypothetical protein